MSELESHFVWRGLWTNLEQGSVMGLTITTDSRTGTILISVLSLLASLASTHLWNLLLFALHQSRAVHRPADGLFRQHQVLLRVLPTPIAFMAESLKLWLKWRNRADHPFLRVVGIAFFSVALAVASLIGGVFSAYVVSTSNIEVLVRNPSCGLISIPQMDSNLSYGLTYGDVLTELGHSYSRDCYRNDPLPTRCHNIFHRPNIAVNPQYEECPFNAAICLPGLSAISMDSGLLDMSKYFGLNLKDNDGVRFRKKSTCSILQHEGHYSISNITASLRGQIGRDALPQEEFLSFYYTVSRDLTMKPRESATFIQSLSSSNITRSLDAMGRTIHSSSNWSNSGILKARASFDPLSELRREDSDLGIIVVWNNAVRFSPVDDPLFAAHQEDYIEIDGDKITIWTPDFPGRVIGCTQQYQFCIAQSGRNDSCTSLAGLSPEFTHDTLPEANDIQLAALRLLNTIAIIADTSHGANAGLKAQDSQSYRLPDDQWIKELVGWEQHVLAWYQILLAGYAIGPVNQHPIAKQFTRIASTTGEKQLCQVMKMRKASGFANINLFGLVFIIVFSVVVTALDTVLLKCLVFLGRYRRAFAPKADLWIQDGPFQLQRRAYEAHGEGEWVDLEQEIPVTRERQILADIPIESLPRISIVPEKPSRQSKTFIEHIQHAEQPSSARNSHSKDDIKHEGASSRPMKF